MSGTWSPSITSLARITRPPGSKQSTYHSMQSCTGGGTFNGQQGHTCMPDPAGAERKSRA
ncbi:hypothetical protein N7539_004840 [Penicillium diatomitis]|uniref:Uncharacterized protein n=1 Tax=Penicillium diatomitis TaxID=2819901 RepID=A0A9W9X5U1_9EURO|nr:uncharacterized protein N7539_004840 [Penicillium diatomitis]KAJ5484852.1 hypothetical protein N7539_004840 [Penicillium diatomitis]